MKTEKAFTIALLVGLLFKFLHWPGGGILVVLSLTSLALLYCFGAVYFFSDNSLSKSNHPLSITSGIFLGTALIGMLFKLQYWPGASLLLTVGTVSSAGFFLLTLYLSSKAAPELANYYKNMKLRTAVLTILTVILYFTSTESLVKAQYWNDPEMARIKALHYAYPENNEYRLEHDRYMLSLDSNYQVESLEEQE